MGWNSFLSKVIAYSRGASRKNAERERDFSSDWFANLYLRHRLECHSLQTARPPGLSMQNTQSMPGRSFSSGLAPNNFDLCIHEPLTPGKATSTIDVHAQMPRIELGPRLRWLLVRDGFRGQGESGGPRPGRGLCRSSHAKQNEPRAQCSPGSSAWSATCHQSRKPATHVVLDTRSTKMPGIMERKFAASSLSMSGAENMS